MRFMARAYVWKGDYTKFYLSNMAFFYNLKKKILFLGEGVDKRDSNLGFLIILR